MLTLSAACHFISRRCAELVQAAASKGMGGVTRTAAVRCPTPFPEIGANCVRIQCREHLRRAMWVTNMKETHKSVGCNKGAGVAAMAASGRTRRTTMGKETGDSESLVHTRAVSTSNGDDVAPKLAYRWIRLPKHCAVTGDTPNTVHARRRKEIWRDGVQCSIGPNGNLYVNPVE